MSGIEVVRRPTTRPSPPAVRGTAWLEAARRARMLAWVSLAWMSIEGVAGVAAGLQARSLGVVTWAASSFVEALASLLVVWRFTGRRTLSATSEVRAQRLVGASFFLLAPYFVVEAVRKLLDGGRTDATVFAVLLTGSAIVLMPLLGWAKVRLGRRLGSGATRGEGVQNLLCAGQAAAALAALVGAGAGFWWLDPVAALAIAAIALREGRDGWRGTSCCAPIPVRVADAPCDDPCCS